jgi:hypothetical protein
MRAWLYEAANRYLARLFQIPAEISSLEEINTPVRQNIRSTP